jgi:hypothetical protein
MDLSHSFILPLLVLLNLGKAIFWCLVGYGLRV